MFFELMASQASMELNKVEIIGFHSAQAVFHPGPDVFCSMNMLGSHGCAGHTSAFRGKQEFRAAVSNEPADQFFAATIIDRSVNEIDTNIEDCIQHLLRLLVGDCRAYRLTAQFHCTKTQSRDLQSGSSQCSFR